MEKEIMEKMNKILDDMLEKMSRGKREMEIISKRIDEVLDEPCIIKIDKKENGEACLHLEGNTLALLVTLAGAEQNILKQLKCTDMNFERIKSMIGTVDMGVDKDNE